MWRARRPRSTRDRSLFEIVGQRHGDAEFIALLGAGAFGTSACIIRRQAALDASLFDETLRFGEDTDLFLRLALAGRFAFTRAKMMHKREHDSNLTHARNTPEFDRAKVLSLTHLSAQAETFKLSAAEKDALHAKLTRAIAFKQRSSVSYCAMMCGAAFLVWLGGTNRIPVKPFLALVFLADISYSFYLLHDDIGFVKMKWLLQWGVNAYVTLALTFAVAVAISYVMNRLVERPGQRALRATFKRWRERFAAQTWRPTAPKPLAGD